MRIQPFNIQTTLTFLLGDGRTIEAGTEAELWRKLWRAFMPLADELRDDGQFYEFQRVCRFYNFDAVQQPDHLWRLGRVNLATLETTALPEAQ